MAVRADKLPALTAAFEAGAAVVGAQHQGAALLEHVDHACTQPRSQQVHIACGWGRDTEPQPLAVVGANPVSLLVRIGAPISLRPLGL